MKTSSAPSRFGSRAYERMGRHWRSLRSSWPWATGTRWRLPRSGRFITAPMTTLQALPESWNSRGLRRRTERHFKRSVLFITFAGEELGLAGFIQFREPSDDPLKNVVAHDQHGYDRPHQQRSAFYWWRRHVASSFKPSLEDAQEIRPLCNSTIPIPDMAQAITRPLMPRKSRCCFSFPGLHTDYHKPSDTYGQDQCDGRHQGSLAGLYDDGQDGQRMPSRLEYTEVQQPKTPASGKRRRLWSVLRFGSGFSRRSERRALSPTYRTIALRRRQV